MHLSKACLWATLVALGLAKIEDAKIDLAPLGPGYLPAANHSSQAWTDAIQKATELLNQFTKTGNSTYGPFDNQGTSFSASFFTLASDKPLFEYHYEAPTLNGSYTKGKLTENTIYRTGSLGKLLTMYTWLADIGDSVYMDPITKYIPELAEAAKNYRNPLTQTNWSDVTVGSLASQLSGIGRDFTLGDLAIPTFQSPPPSDAIPAGYPPLKNESLIQCSSYDDQLPPCTRKQFLDGVINHPPVWSSYRAPSYSNLAYAILGLAYESITGKNVSEGQRDMFVSRLGMTSTTPTYPGPDADAVIPRNDSYAVFSYDIGIQGPAGNQYTSTKDLRTWGRAILNHTILSGSLTRRWMKPATFTSAWQVSVGAPWEIYRYTVPVNTIINSSRIVDTYTKGGDIGLYSTLFGLVPDYNMGFSVMTAGDHPHDPMTPVRATLIDIFYKAAEAAAKAQAKSAFTGTFKATDRNSSVVLAVDGGPGVVIKQWISNGTNLLANEFLSSYDDFRLYPTDLAHTENGMTYYRYHMVALTNHGEPTQGDPWPEVDEYWLQVDEYDYNNLATDAIVVGFDGDGIVQSIASDALRSTYSRA